MKIPLSEQSRYYPRSCTSMFCGDYADGCNGCSYKPVLDEFKDWRKQHDAYCPDEIWNPLPYLARV